MRMEPSPSFLCPGCLSATPVGGPDRWDCPGCGRRFHGLRGIPDLRTAEDGYLSNAEDWDRARQLDRRFDELDSIGLLNTLLELDPSVDPAGRLAQVAHLLSAPDRTRAWLAALGDVPSTKPILDLGCGSGSFLVSAAEQGVAHLAGVDIALRWLLVARKRLDDAGLSHIPLVCGNAESLPWPASSVAAVVAGDVIEHVADQPQTLAEAYRVLEPGGALFLAVPNRYSLTPEPHVRVWGVGFLPRRWMTRYVRHVSGRDFRAVRTLGRGEWRRLLHESPFHTGSVAAPLLPEGDLRRFGRIKRAVAVLHNRVVAHPFGQAIAQRIGPMFHVVCRKPTPSPAILPHSRRTASPARAARP